MGELGVIVSPLLLAVLWFDLPRRFVFLSLAVPWKTMGRWHKAVKLWKRRWRQIRKEEADLSFYRDAPNVYLEREVWIPSEEPISDVYQQKPPLKNDQESGLPWDSELCHQKPSVPSAAPLLHEPLAPYD